MDKKRREVIAYQLVLKEAKKLTCLKDLESLERKAGKKTNEKEFKNKGISAEELVHFEKEVIFDTIQNLLDIDLEGFERMDKKLRNKIAYQYVLHLARVNFSFKKVHNFKREIGDIIREKELMEKGISAEELVEFTKEVLLRCYSNIFNGEQMRRTNERIKYLTPR